MEVENSNPEVDHDDPTWQLIAEFSLNEGILAEFLATELTVGSIFHAMRDQRIPVDCIKRIKGTIAETVKGARSSFPRRLPDSHVRISVFSNKKAKARVHHSGDQIIGGWGYYVIEKGRDLLNATCQDCPREVELFIYEEGE